MGARLDGVLLGGQPEGVEAQRVQHVVAGHPRIAGVDVRRDVAEGVADVQSRTRGVREHVHDELFGLGGLLGVTAQRSVAGVGRLVGAVLLPEILPACLDVGGQGRRVAMGGRALGGGGRLAHRPQSSIGRLCPALLKRKKTPRTGGGAAPMPVRGGGPAVIQRGSLSRRRTARIALRVPHAAGPGRRPPAARPRTRNAGPDQGREQRRRGGPHLVRENAVLRGAPQGTGREAAWSRHTKSGMQPRNPRLHPTSCFCGAKENRTPDLLHAMQALYQLSYSPRSLVRRGLPSAASPAYTGYTAFCQIASRDTGAVGGPPYQGRTPAVGTVGP